MTDVDPTLAARAERLLALTVGSRPAPPDAPGPRVLEVHQLWGEVLLGSHQFPPGRDVDAGDEVGAAWSLAGVPLGFVPSALAPLLRVSPPLWSEVRSVPRPAVHVDAPLSGPHLLFRADGEHHVARVPEGWAGFVDVGDERLTLDDAVAAGRARARDGVIEVTVSDGLTLVVEAGSTVLVARRVRPGARAAAVRRREDRPFTLAAGLTLALGAAFSFVVASTPHAPAVVPTDDAPPAVIDEALVTFTPPPVTATPDVRGVAKARDVEGRSGDRNARAPHRSGSPGRGRSDAEVAGAAGIAGAMGGFLADLGLGADVLASAAAGLHGPRGVQLGGGLGREGNGKGGGGDVASLGGLDPIGGGSDPMRRGGDLGPRTERKWEPKQDAVVIGEAIDRALVDRIIKNRIAQFRYCYQRRLQVSPGLAGKVAVTFTIASDGSVSAARIKQSSVGDAEVDACLVQKFRTLQFPAPKGGGIAIVTYPFLFSPG